MSGHIARLTGGTEGGSQVRSAALRCVENDILRTPAVGASSVLHRNTCIEQEHALPF